MDRDTFEHLTVAERQLATKMNRDFNKDMATERFERLVQQAEVAMDRLTGSAEWDGFVQIVQSRLEAAKDDYEHEAYRLAHESFSADVIIMMQHRLKLAGLRRVLDTLEWIIELPREIMDAAAAAGVEEEEES